MLAGCWVSAPLGCLRITGCSGTLLPFFGSFSYLSMASSMKPRSVVYEPPRWAVDLATPMPCRWKRRERRVGLYATSPSSPTTLTTGPSLAAIPVRITASRTCALVTWA